MFNDNFERIAGTFGADLYEKMLRKGNKNEKIVSNSIYAGTTKYNKSSGVLIPKLFRIRIFFDPILFMDSKLVLIKYFFEFILDDLCIHILNL